MRQFIFNRPIHYPESSKQILVAILFISIGCCAFLIFFQPFGVNNYDPAEKISLALIFAVLLIGGVIFVVLSINEFVIRPLFIRQFTAGKLLLWLAWSLLFVGSASYIVYNLLGGWHDWNLASYLDFLKNMAVLGSLPIILVVLYFGQLYLQQTIGTLKEVGRSERNTNDLVLFTADNEKDKIVLPIAAILFLESQDNYVALNYLDDEVVKKYLLRSTLKRMEAELSETAVVKCHRSFLVNLDKVTSASGNVHRMDLALGKVPGKIPVSRNFTETITAALGKRSG